MKRKAVAKPYTKQTAEELAKSTAEFDQEFSADTFTTPDEKARVRWNKVKAKRGRPKVGRGVRVVSVSLEKGLLTKADRLAKKLGVSRAKLISEGLESMISEHA